MFVGTYSHSIDDKGRIAIPRDFRELLPPSGPGEVQVVVTKSVGGAPSLDVYTPHEWATFEGRLRALPQFQERTRQLKRLYLAPARRLTLDAQGRILLPPDLRTWISLSKEAVFTGDLEKFLVWSREGWDEQAAADAEARAGSVGSFEDLGF